MVIFRYLLIVFATGFGSWTSIKADVNQKSPDHSRNHDCGEHDSEHWCTDEIAVKIDGDAGHADHVAEIHGFKNAGQVRTLSDVTWFWRVCLYLDSYEYVFEFSQIAIDKSLESGLSFDRNDRKNGQFFLVFLSIFEPPNIEESKVRWFISCVRLLCGALLVMYDFSPTVYAQRKCRAPVL